MENQISILTYHKAKYLENLQVKLLCNKCGYHETPKMRTKYQKAKYKENFEMKREYQKRKYQENTGIYKKYHKRGSCNINESNNFARVNISFDKLNRGPIIFA